MRRRDGRARLPLLPLFVALLAGVVLAQLGGRVVLGSQDDLAPEIAIPAFQGDVDRDSRQEITSFARALPFAQWVGQGDEQALLVESDTGSVAGPRLRIEPVRGAHQVRHSDLVEGRFVARVINRSDRAVPGFGLGPRDTVYWWTDSVAHGRWRGVFLSSDPAMGPVELVVTPTDAPPDVRMPFPVALARWVVTEEGVEAWVTCASRSSCQTVPVSEAP